MFKSLTMMKIQIFLMTLMMKKAKRMRILMSQ